MSYRLSIDVLREKFGDVHFEVLSQGTEARTSCVRRASDDRVLAFSEVSFHQDALILIPSSVHEQILSGEPLGLVIEKSGIEHERMVREEPNTPMSDELKRLFETALSECVTRSITCTVKEKKYLSIREFYNPEFITVS